MWSLQDFEASSNLWQFDSNLEFNPNPTNGTDVLQDFDFDSFLHQDAEVTDGFGFDTTGFLDGDVIGAE